MIRRGDLVQHAKHGTLAVESVNGRCATCIGEKVGTKNFRQRIQMVALRPIPKEFETGDVVEILDGEQVFAEMAPSERPLTRAPIGSRWIVNRYVAPGYVSVRQEGKPAFRINTKLLRKLPPPAAIPPEVQAQMDEYMRLGAMSKAEYEEYSRAEEADLRTLFPDPQPEGNGEQSGQWLPEPPQGSPDSEDEHLAAIFPDPPPVIVGVPVSARSVRHLMQMAAEAGITLAPAGWCKLKMTYPKDTPEDLISALRSWKVPILYEIERDLDMPALPPRPEPPLPSEEEKRIDQGWIEAGGDYFPKEGEILAVYRANPKFLPGALGCVEYGEVRFTAMMEFVAQLLRWRLEHRQSFHSELEFLAHLKLHTDELWGLLDTPDAFRLCCWELANKLLYWLFEENEPLPFVNQLD